MCSASPYWPLSKSSRAEGSAVLPDALVQRVAFGGAVAPVGLPGEVVAAVHGVGVGDVQTDAGELDHRGGVRAPRVCAQHRHAVRVVGALARALHEAGVGDCGGDGGGDAEEDDGHDSDDGRLRRHCSRKWLGFLV